MPVTDIRLALSLRTHPKVRKLRARLGGDGVLAVMWLWMHAAETGRVDGRLTAMDAEDIALAADWAGDPQELVEHLEACRLLEHDGECYVIHDFVEHQPYVAGSTARSEAASKAARARWDAKNLAAGAVKSMPGASDRNAGRMNPQCGPHESAMPCAMRNDAGRMRGASDRIAGGNAPSPSPLPEEPPLSPPHGDDAGPPARAAPAGRKRVGRGKTENLRGKYADIGGKKRDEGEPGKPGEAAQAGP